VGRLDERFFGGHKAVVRPDPIPNSAVKHSLADGSGFIDSARVGCRQFFLKSRDAPLRFGFFISLVGWRKRALLSYRRARTPFSAFRESDSGITLLSMVVAG
jgi:hypothetical protein